MSLSYSLKYAFRSFLREKWINLLSIFTVASSFLVVSIFLVIAFNIDRFTSKLPDRFSMLVYLKHDLSKDETARVIEEIKRTSGVLTASYTDRDAAFRELRQALKENRSILDGLDDNPLSPYVEVKFRADVVTAANLASIATGFRSAAGVDDVYYPEKIAETVRIVLGTLHQIGFAVLIIIGSGILFVMYATVKILFYRRRDEIETLQLLGATGTFIRFPFLVEGCVIGCFGGILSAGVTAAFFAIFTEHAGVVIPLLKTIVFPYELFLILPVAGIAVGIAGGLVAIGRLRV